MYVVKINIFGNNCHKDYLLLEYIYVYSTILVCGQGDHTKSCHLAASCIGSMSILRDQTDVAMLFPPVTMISHDGAEPGKLTLCTTVVWREKLVSSAQAKLGGKGRAMLGETSAHKLNQCGTQGAYASELL